MADFVDRYQPPQRMQRTLYRPKTSPIETPRLWWRYAIRSVVLQLRFIRNEKNPVEVQQDSEFIEELHHEAQLLYLKETPLGLRIMTMEGLREEVEFLRSENELLKSMLANSYAPMKSARSMESTRKDAASYESITNKQEMSTISIFKVSDGEVAQVEGETSPIPAVNADDAAHPDDEPAIENEADAVVEVKDHQDLLDEEFDDNLPISSIEMLLDAAMAMGKESFENGQTSTVSTVTWENPQLDQDDASQRTQPIQKRSDDLSLISKAPPVASPAPPVGKKVSYRSQLQQHVQRMHRATVIRTVAAQNQSIHLDQEVGTMRINGIASEPFHGDPLEATTEGKPAVKREQLPVVDKMTRSRLVAKAYNTAPYVLRPATRSPSRNSRSKKPKSRSPVRRAAESSRSPRPGEGEDDDASSRDVERASGPPTESSITRLPVIPVDMRDVEKVAVEIIHKVRTHNGKKSHSPAARRKLSPSELVLLKRYVVHQSHYTVRYSRLTFYRSICVVSLSLLYVVPSRSRCSLRSDGLHHHRRAPCHRTGNDLHSRLPPLRCPSPHVESSHK